MYRILQKPPAAGNLQLTDRDILWLRAVHRFRFITTDQAQIMAGAASRKKLNERLRALWAHDYLDRPEVQRRVYAYSDKRHVVHALGQRGADFLTEHDGVSFPKGKGWTFANQVRSGERLEHQIGVVDTMLHFEQAASQVAGLRLIHSDELLTVSPGWPKGLKPHRLPTQRQTPDGGVVARGTDPDYTFGFGLQSSGKEQRALFFLEWDNATENYVKSNVLASSIAQKFDCYADAYRRKLHTELYGFNNFRVLFVVQGSDARVRKMQHVFDRRMQGRAPAGVFLFATMEEFAAHGPLAEIWINGAGEPARLLPSTPQ